MEPRPVTALLDTGFLLAVLDEDDDLHAACVAALLMEPAPILPDVVLPELAYMVIRELGYDTLTGFLQSILAGEVPSNVQRRPIWGAASKSWIHTVIADRDELRREYPELEDEDIRQAFLFVATGIEDRMVEFAL